MILAGDESRLSAKAVATRAGVGGATFYEHFRNLQDLLRPLADELFDDPHLSRPEARVDVALEDGTVTWLPGLPLELDSRRPRGGRNPPRLGEHTVEVAEELGYSSQEIRKLIDAGVLAMADAVQA
jgi:AcrR family transcriptional regulator